MFLKRLITAVAILGCVAGQGLAQDKPLWDSTVGDLIGAPPAARTSVAATDEPASVNIEFVVDQCDAGVVEPIDLAEFLPDAEPEAAPLPAAEATTEAEVETEPLPEAAPAPEQRTPLPNPMDIAVAPDAVLPSLESFATPASLNQRGPIEISPSILYLP